MSTSGEWMDCGACNGAGADRIGKCQACGGRGQVWAEDEEEEEEE